MHCFFLILRQFFLILRQSLAFCRVFIASISWRNENIISTILNWNFEFRPSLLHFDRLCFILTVLASFWPFLIQFDHLWLKILKIRCIWIHENSFWNHGDTNCHNKWKKQWISMTTIEKSENALPFWSHCIRQFGYTAQHASFFHETKPIFVRKWSQDVNVSDEFNSKANMHTKTLKM